MRYPTVLMLAFFVAVTLKWASAMVESAELDDTPDEDEVE
jgi:hypothetical protein